jgi:hypothetical protein
MKLILYASPSPRKGAIEKVRKMIVTSKFNLGKGW